MSMDNSTLAIALTEVRYLRSQAVGEEFKLCIAHPPATDTSSRRLPVIVVLDGNGVFGLSADVVRLLQNNAIPPSYVVGVGYRGGAMVDTLMVRARDYTPTRCARFEEHFPKALGSNAPLVTGGGPAFLSFLSNELMPFLAQNFPIDTNDATLTGMSLGGLFATYALLSSPAVFRRYIICSPSLLYDDEAIFQREADYARSHRELGARVFLGCGALENEAELQRQLQAWPEHRRQHWLAMWRPRMVEVVEPFVERLRTRNFAGLHLECNVFPDENHQSVYPAVLSRGLRYVFRS
jgi:predicted alpha/beta superfamily hydrolase